MNDASRHPDVASPDVRGWRATRAGAAFAPLAGVACLRVRGEDRVDFLQGQLANDVRGLPEDGTIRALLLDAKGHARAEARVIRGASALDLAVEDRAAGWVHERLGRHVVFDQVQIEDLADDLAALTLQGPDAHGVLGRLGASPPPPDRVSTAVLAGTEVRLVPARRSEAGGVDLVLASDGAATVLEALGEEGAEEVPWGALEASRVAAGLPRAGTEAGAGVLPQEAELFEAFSTRKGCYLGQEIMARLEARGRVKRTLVGLHFPSGPPATPEADVPGDAAVRPQVRHAGRTVGVAGTRVVHPELGAIGLAVVRRDLPEDAELEVGGVSANVRPLPFAAVAAG